MRDVVIFVRDDLDGSDATETISFAVRGVAYEIDLSAANVELFDKSLQQFIDAARVQAQAAQVGAASSKLPVSRELKRRRKEIRDWAIKNGWPELEGVSRGRTPYAAVEAYKRANPGVSIPGRMLPDDRPTEHVETVTAQQMLALGTVQSEGVSAHKLIKAKKSNPQRVAAATMAQRRAEKFGDRLESLDKDRRNEIRTWANENGFQQSMSGYLKAEVLEAFFTAHPGDN